MASAGLLAENRHDLRAPFVSNHHNCGTDRREVRKYSIRYPFYNGRRSL